MEYSLADEQYPKHFFILCRDNEPSLGHISILLWPHVSWSVQGQLWFDLPQSDGQSPSLMECEPDSVLQCHQRLHLDQRFWDGSLAN